MTKQRIPSYGLAALLFAGLLFGAGSAEAQGGARSGSIGVGGMIGDPTGLSMKFRLPKTFAIDLGVGWNAVYATDFQAHVDFLWNIDLTQRARANMLFYFGVGPKLGWWGSGGWGNRDNDGFMLGARAPLGLDWEFNRRRLDVFVEFAPGIAFLPQVYFYPDAAVGARYWF
ncbi:MAG: hypothetical protein U0230_01740 [Polyangiales bacterium]